LSSKWVYPAVLKNFISFNINHFLSLCLRVQISLPYRTAGTASALYKLIFLFENYWTKLCIRLYSTPDTI
jgi:hypothetical protein